MVYVFPRFVQNVGINLDGAAMYISPRLLRGYLSQKYLLDDPFDNFPNFELVHSESALVVKNLNDQGANIGEFVYFQGIHGPIKIWEISYTGEEKEVPAYIDKDPTRYLDWEL